MTLPQDEFIFIRTKGNGKERERRGERYGDDEEKGGGTAEASEEGSGQKEMYQEDAGDEGGGMIPDGKAGGERGNGEKSETVEGGGGEKDDSTTRARGKRDEVDLVIE